MTFFRNHLGWLAPIGALIGLAWLCWMAIGNDKIQFLPSGSAPWIVYPSPFNGETIPAVELPADFHRSFTLAQKPEKAVLAWRCFRDGRVVINGQSVNAPVAGNWKRAARMDVSNLLRTGTNDIEMIASAASGPPSISVRLEAGDVTVESDENWDVSYAGALRLPARLATEEPDSIPGGDLRTFKSIRKIWAWELLFFVGSAAMVGILWRRRNGKVVAAALGILWIALLVHNESQINFCLGFDATAHLHHIDYILTHRTLPRANQGWEMFQPPLYYVACAELLRLCQCLTYSGKAMLLLRAFNVIAGAANIALIFWGLRMVFPQSWEKQLAGTTLGAFAPCQFYLLHYTTNEVLAATLATASLCFCLKCLLTETPSILWLAALGVALGAACWTKASAIALLPVIFATLTADLIARRERAPLTWLRNLGLVAALVVTISGSHYWQLWRDYGSPLAGNWTPGVREPWWQQPGYLTGGYFTTFGRSLVAPYFASFHSFWDGLYATFWGDSLWGGQLQNARAPWNYEFMTVGFLLALPMAGLIVTGAVIGIARWMRAPSASGLLLVGTPSIYLLAVAYMTLKLPLYDQAKAFYALPALLPVCVFAVEGWEFWARRSAAVGFCLLAAAGALLVNNCAAFWIRGDSAQFRLCRALSDHHGDTQGTLVDFQSVLAVEPHSAVAEMYLALLDRETGRADQFAADLQTARTDHPDDADICALDADREARNGNWNAALPLAERAARLAPDDYATALSWMRFARDNHRDADVVTAGELVLRNRPALTEVHQAMAEALERLGQPTAAALHQRLSK